MCLATQPFFLCAWAHVPLCPGNEGPGVTHHPNDGHPPSTGWSPTFHRMVTLHSLDGLSAPGWSPSITIQLSTIPRMVTKHTLDGHHTTIPRTFTHHPQDGDPLSKRWLHTIPTMVTN